MAAQRKKNGNLEPTRGVYMISVAAELASMHPQTLRIYESRGLITPERSPKGTRLYSQEDVERLRRIQELTSELGMNLAGVERVFELELEIEKMRRRMERLEREAQAMQRKLREELEKVRKSFKAELVPYTGARRRDLVPVRAHSAGARRFVVPIKRTQDDGRA
jgi:MerR family transcriptional regulator/heat shock protein HspR